ncbi:DUF1501 domain-containing protein [Paludisphaera mucosa]|uniref:DUF1501 domain-containing protein n=1 Tax=Paludisphaera mucosa TaxID=3030827 RepID=A0ABT6F806_9BACT|nr:DUF1501 domain-containing protein [Paludisphaera mucosa]MDG3003611.1 DUF1501 domain-containing protein [Paludisphaera mucosa]
MNRSANEPETGRHRQSPIGLDRREFLSRSAGGFGALALNWLAQRESAAGTHHRPRATRVIQLFMLGGASQCDTFDYKPELIRRHGESVPFTVTGGTVTTAGPVLKSPWKWARHGETGRWVTNALPHLAGCVDDMAFLYSMHAPTSEHSAAQTMQGSGFVIPGFPSVGSWVSYALGSESDDLPAFVALPDPVGLPWTGKAAWTNGFLPAVHQGVMLNPSAVDPVPDLFASKSARYVTAESEREGLGELAALNRLQAAAAPGDSRLEARIAGYELAARMQLAVPDVLEVQAESRATHALYGLDDPLTEPFGRNCLIARRMVERGVRFVQVWCGSGINGGAQNWDNHGDVTPGSDFERMCVRSDRPIAGLLKDLKARGLLDETVVLWTTEFGRTPYSQGGKGRDHNGNTFVSWMAGGGVKPGASFGASDEFSFHAAVDPIMCYDQHATLLHLLGIDHRQLTVRHNGADRRLTDVHGKVLHEIIA